MWCTTNTRAQGKDDVNDNVMIRSSLVKFVAEATSGLSLELDLGCLGCVSLVIIDQGLGVQFLISQFLAGCLLEGFVFVLWSDLLILGLSCVCLCTCACLCTCEVGLSHSLSAPLRNKVLQSCSGWIQWLSKVC